MLNFTRWHRPLMLVSGFMVALMAVSVVGLIADDRMLLGAPIWLKPFKFSVSFAIYSVTLAWLLSLPHKGQRWTWWLGTILAVLGGLIDVSIVFLQAARGTFSHFNGSADPFDDNVSMMFSMGVNGILLGSLGIAAVLGFQRLGDRAFSRAVHTGLFLAVVGIGVGMLMAFVPDGQVATDAMGRAVQLHGGHSIGVPDGTAGMPLTNWSTSGGDLRAAHFLGLHGLQVMLLAGMGLSALSHRVSVLRAGAVRASLLTVLASGYTGLVLVAAWQALRGQSLIHPDVITLTALGGVAVATAVGCWAMLRRPAEPRR